MFIRGGALIGINSLLVYFQKHMYKYEKLLKNARRPEVLIKEIKVSKVWRFQISKLIIPGSSFV